MGVLRYFLLLKGPFQNLVNLFADREKLPTYSFQYFLNDATFASLSLVVLIFHTKTYPF